MRIDIGLNTLRPEFSPGRTNTDLYELKGRGENIRGRILDINQDTVLVQSSTGRQYTAHTTMPLDSYLGEEILFAVFYTQEDQVVLNPLLDPGQIKQAIDLRIEDFLAQLKQTPNAQNKEIVAELLKSGLAVSKENFKDIKQLTLALQILQKIPLPTLSLSQKNLPLPELVKLLEKNPSPNSPDTTNSNFTVKDLVLLKALGITGSLKNLQALATVQQNLQSPSSDLFQMSSKESLDLYEASSGLFLSQDHQIQEESAEPSLKTLQTFPEQSKDTAPLELKQPIQMDVLPDRATAKALNPASNKETLQTFLGSSLPAKENGEDALTDYEPLPALAISKPISRQSSSLAQPTDANDRSLGSLPEPTLKREFQKIQQEVRQVIQPEETLKKPLRTDFAQVASRMEDIIQSLAKPSAFAYENLSQVHLLKEMAQQFQFQVVPFQIDQYQNHVQYYIKKRKNQRQEDHSLQIAISLNTHTLGNVRANLTHREGKIKIELQVSQDSVKRLFERDLIPLQQELQRIGYQEVVIDTSIVEKKSPLLDEAYYQNELKSGFERWV